MRINKYIASASGLSRRAADTAIAQGRVLINGAAPQAGQSVDSGDVVQLDGQTLRPNQAHQTIMLNKPAGYIVSRDGQGSRTIYDLLPLELHHLKPVGRLDKYSSGLLLLTTDGGLANRLTHPSYHKSKQYIVKLNRPLSGTDADHITQRGVMLEDGMSSFELAKQDTPDHWIITMYEGRNRQIRRTFQALHYDVVKLHRIQFGTYILPRNLRPGTYIVVPKTD